MRLKVLLIMDISFHFAPFPGKLSQASFSSAGSGLHYEIL